MAGEEAVLAHRIAKALEDMPREYGDDGDVPLCQDVEVLGSAVYATVEDHQYVIEISDAM